MLLMRSYDCGLTLIRAYSAHKQILQELKGKIKKLVPAAHAGEVESFVAQYQRVAGQLRALIYRASCPQIIKFNNVSTCLSRLAHHTALFFCEFERQSHAKPRLGEWRC
jgi:hypothetical protein